MKRATSSRRLLLMVVAVVIMVIALTMSGGGQYFFKEVLAWSPGAGENVILDNEYSVMGKDNGGTARGMLAMTNTNRTRLNAPPGSDILFTFGGAETAKLTSAGHFVLRNNASIQGLDTGGIARGLLVLNNTNDTLLNTPPGNDILFTVGGSEKMRITSNGNVGIGTTTPTQGKLEVVTGSGDGVRGYSNSRDGVSGSSNSSGLWAGVYGTNYGSGFAGYFSGKVHVTGELTAGTKTFKIDHPQDPANKYLIHSVIESPDMKNVYDGTIMLDDKGEALISMPSYFESLNRDFRYQLTAVGAPGPNLYISQKIAGNQFKIAGGTPNMEVSWQVTGIRKDAYANAHPIQVEQEKPANEKGLYLHPKEWGQPEDKGINQAQKP